MHMLPGDMLHNFISLERGAETFKSISEVALPRRVQSLR